MKKIIRILVVEDSLLISKLLTMIFNADPQFVVAGVAYNGREAIELTSELKPDLITMDINLPVMDGIEAIKQIMAYNPTPILVISASIYDKAKIGRASCRERV